MEDACYCDRLVLYVQMWWEDRESFTSPLAYSSGVVDFDIRLVWSSMGYAEECYGYVSLLARLVWSSSEHRNLESSFIV